MSEIKRVKIDSILESQIPEFLNEESPLFGEFLKQYYYSLEHQSGTLDLVNNLKQYKNIEQFNSETLIESTSLTSEILSFDAIINVASTKGWPDKYGLFKIDDEIITYLSKTDTSFVDCIRGFSGIDEIVSDNNSKVLNFLSTNADEHLITSKVINLSNLFLVKFFEKYRFEFFPGFESREFIEQLSLPNILTSAKNFYSSKGTDASYKLLFKILYGKDIEIIKPQDNTLVPSSNVYFITKNILVEKISGTGNPTDLPGNFIFQTLSGIGTVSASIFNVEYRPVDNKEFYEISLDSTSLDGTFQVSGKTKITENVEIGADTILVDSTIGFSPQGVLTIKTESNDLVKIDYQDTTVNQFLGVTGIDRFLQFGTEIIEEKFATSFVGFGNTSPINFRVINVIDNIDSSKTSNMRVGDTVKLSGFGKDLSAEVRFNSWIYNIPTSHQISSISKLNTNLYQIILFDEILVYLNEIITLVDENENKINATIVSVQFSVGSTKKLTNTFTIQVQENLYNVSLAQKITKFITKSKHNTDYFPNLSQIPAGIQNTYIDVDGQNLILTSSGFPNYVIYATDNKKTVQTFGVGRTDIFYALNHQYTTGESIYYQPNGVSGINTGIYQVTVLDNNNLKLSLSKSDIFSKKYVQANSNILSDEMVKSGYENKTIKHQKLLKQINLLPTPLQISDDENLRITSGVNKQLGILVNGTELFSSTIFDESIYYGKLNSIEVIDSGSGYDVIDSPDIQVFDSSGSGVKAKLNIIGNVKEVKILFPGVGYQNKPKITITGGNGQGCVLESNLVSSKITSFFNAKDGVNVIDDEITFDSTIAFENNEEIVYNSNGNSNIPGIVSGSAYFIGIVTDNTVKVYNNLQDCFSQVNAINITGISSGVHKFTTLANKNTISKIYILDPGKGYSNRSIRVPSILAFDDNTLGINTYDSYIFAKNHGFNTGEVVKYDYTDIPITGMSSTSHYYVDVISSDKFRLASAGVGGTLSNINLINKKYEPLNTLGFGTHIISYPPIEIKIESLSAIGSTTIINPILKPIILGSVEDVFLEDGGVSFGCTDILNFNRRPFVGLSSIQSEALLQPIILDSSIVGVKILNKGRGYRKDVDIIIEGTGKFAELSPVVEDGALVAVNIISSGIGYASTTTTLKLKNRGVGLKLLANINEWKINQVIKSKNLISDADDGILYPNLNKDLGLQFVNLFIPKQLRLQLSDNITRNNTESSGILNHSPILGFAYDGNPIYGSYAYETSLGGPIIRMKSGYISDLNTNPNLRPAGFEVGYFIDDFKFIGSGDLDEFNGRFCVTPDFPDGVYAYFSTIDVSSVGSGVNVPSGAAIPSYPYVIGNKFKDIPITNNFIPKFNQNFGIFGTNLVRNIGPYYLNNTASDYEIFDSISNDYKQELRVENITAAGIENAVIFNSGDNYKVGDIVLLDNKDTGGSSANIVVSRIIGRDVSSTQVTNNLIENVEFVIRSNKVVGKTSGITELKDGQFINILGISTTTSSNLEGMKSVKIIKKEVELVNNIPNVGTTGVSTKIVVRDTSGFKPNDFIGIGTEILLITKISTIDSSFNVNRVLNTGIHTAGLENVVLLPKEFEFITDVGTSDFTFGNQTIFFNPKEDVGTGAAGTTRIVSGIYTSFTRNIPKRSIYIPRHKFFTGEELIYNCGLGGTSLFVNNVGSGVSFKLENNQKVYAVNLGLDYVGLSTIGFTSTSGIGSQFNSLEFRNLDEFFGTIGVAHSLTTTNTKISGAIESKYIEVTTTKPHNLTDGDSIKLKVEISDEEEIKVIYDPVNRKVILKEISFTDNEVSQIENTINVSSYNGEIKTGDKVVYIAESPIGGLSNYGIYYVLKDNLNEIKLCEYISDINPIGNINEINNINFSSTGGNIQKLYFINPTVTIFRGNIIKFDVSDSSLLDMELVFYYDKKLTKRIDLIGSSLEGFLITRSGLPGISDSYVSINTAVQENIKVLYYNLVPVGTSDSEKIQISTDTSVPGANHINLLDHSLNFSVKIDVLDDNSFAFYNNKALTYVELQALPTAKITYDTNSKTALGPISKLKVNFGGRGYKKLPTVTSIRSENGTDAVVKIVSPTVGRIESFSRVKDGFDYPTDPTLSPTLSVPSVVGIKDIKTIGSISVIFGGKNYNVSPILIVPQNPKIKLQSFASGGSVQTVNIITNSTELSNPLEIISTRNSNGFDIDFITVNQNEIELELLNSNLIPVQSGSNVSIFPFAVGDEIFVENCRLTDSTNSLANFNSENYGYQFFPVVGINTVNNTVTYSMSGISTGNFGTYDNEFYLGFVVNKKDVPIFKMNLIDDVNYFSSEIVSSDKFTARVMENGWDKNLNQLRLDAGRGEIEVGSKLFGQTSKVNGTVEYFDTFILNSTLGVSRDKVGNIDNSVGILNEFQQRISDNFYYQKFSYSIKGDIPYDIWKESVRSLVHPSGFKEFSDLIIYSNSTSNLKPQVLDSTSSININIDSESSMYDKHNFTKVYEQDFLPDGSVEKVYIADGVILSPFILNKTNKVLKIDDISSQFDGSSFQSLDGTYSDASNLLLYNRDLIKEEVVGFITATYPSILSNIDWDRNVTSEKIGLVVDAIAHDVKYESNNKSVEIGLSYWSGIGTSYVAGEEIETIAGLQYISQISKYIINNIGVQTSYQLSTSFNISNLTYDNVTGITTITTSAPHLLTSDDYVVLKNIALSCNSGGGVSTAIFPSLGAGPDGNGTLSPKGFSYKVSVTGISTFTVNPGVSTLTHTYVSGGTVQKAFINASQEFDLSILPDTTCSPTYDENCCANTQSAISNFVGIITTIIGIGTTSAPSEITFPSLTRGGSVVGLSTFKLKNKGTSLFKHVFESQSPSIDIINNKFIIANHNYQSGQKLIYEYDSSPIGIGTTSYVSGITSTLIQVGNFDGTAIFENGYNVAITTTISGLSTTLVPFGISFQQYSSVIGVGTLGIESEFNVLISYNVSTGVPIGTSIVLNKGGRGFKRGDTVSIAGTYLGGTSPTNNLSFIVSDVAPTSISSESNISYSNVPSSDINGAIFNVQRNIDGFVSNVNVVNGGIGYALTSVISIAGTYVGGTSDDIITFSPTELGTTVLPKELYVLKISDNEFRVAGLSTSIFVDLIGIGSGTHSFTYSEPDPSVIISIDGIIQSALRRKSLQITLSEPISTATTTFISVSSGISSLSVNDIININNELVEVKSIGTPTPNKIQIVRGYFDSISGIHTVGAACTVLTGDFKIIGDTIYFTTPPYGKLGLPGITTGSNFAGRVFSRKFDPTATLDKNIILDDISLSFTGLASTQFSIKSDGESVQSIYNNVNSSSFINNNPIVLINNVLQESGSKYEIIDENENKLNFIDGVPKAGKITKVGITTGFGYQPRLGAAAQVVVSVSGTVSSVILTGSGSGYRQSPFISVASTIGSGASITATVGSGGTITGFTVVNPGSGYTSTSIPTVIIGIPTGYSNLPLEYSGVSTGIGQQAKITVEVGMGSSVISFKFDDVGVAYKVGDVLYAPGITTNPYYAGTFEPFLLTVEEVQTDKFSGFYPGQFVKFADIIDEFNGFKKRFTLKALINGQPQLVNFKVPPGSDLNITNNIFIYLNDVLQVPEESYTFKGSRVIFKEAPKPNSVCSIFYYRGSSVDIEEITPPSTIKAGDSIIIKSNSPFDIDQFRRVVKKIQSSDQFDTFLYDSVGISTDPNNERSLIWSKQKNDTIINGALSSKARPDLKSRVQPQAKVIKNITATDDKIYVDNAYPIFTDVDGLPENERDFLILEDRPMEQALAETQVSSSSSISNINITYGGLGYKNTSPNIIVSSSSIVKKDSLFDWNGSLGISSSYQLNSVSYGNLFLGVGNAQSLVISPDGKIWQSSTCGLVTSSNLKSIVSHQYNEQYIYVSVGSGARVIKSTGVGNSISVWSDISLLEERSIAGFGVVSIVNSSYAGTLNDVVYSPSYESYVTVGTGGSIFVGAGIGTNSLTNRNSLTLSDLNSVSFSFNTSINSGYFVAVGDNGVILTSNSGQVWDSMDSPTTQTLNKVIFAEGQFVIVGNSGTVIKSTSQSQYQLISTNVSINFVNINYHSGVYAALDNSGNLYYSLNLSDWVFRSTNQLNVIKDLIFVDSLGFDGRYVLVGFGGTSIYAEPILNRATGIASVSGGIVTSTTITNGGFGYSTLNPPQVIIESDTYDTELVRSFKVTGDHGIIVGINTFITGTPGIGTTTPKIEFVLKSETYDNSSLGIGYSSLNVFGVIEPQLEKGDYFVITDSNVTVGHAFTGITTSLGGMSNYPISKVGTAISFIDGVYAVENVTIPNLGIVTVTCNLAPSPLGNFVQVYKRGTTNSGIGTNGFYGKYSWGKLYDYQNRILGDPKSFDATTDDGIIGLSTSAKIIRTTSLLSN